MAAKILIIEDEPGLVTTLRDRLRKQGYVVSAASDGEKGLEMALREPVDLILLDLMLPGQNGLTVCEKLRKAGSTTPILMLTARADESERIVGLEIGADDYIAKPFSPNELVARVRALLRRAHRQPVEAASVLYGPIAVDSDRHTVSLKGKSVTLTAKEFLLLEYLLKHRGRVLSRDVLLTDVWGYRYTGGTRTVDVHVRRLREKLPVLGDALVTVKQFGYKLLDQPQEQG